MFILDSQWSKDFFYLQPIKYQIKYEALICYVYLTASFASMEKLDMI